jgi:hypothetical protein
MELKPFLAHQELRNPLKQPKPFLLATLMMEMIDHGNWQMYSSTASSIL